MSRIWDLDEAEHMFSTHETVTRPLTSARRPIADISSAVRLGVLLSATAAAAIASNTLSFVESGGTSDVCVVVERAAIPVIKGPDRERRAGIDFARGRSTKQLAAGFKGLFRPSDDIDDSSEDGFVFR